MVFALDSTVGVCAVYAHTEFTVMLPAFYSTFAGT